MGVQEKIMLRKATNRARQALEVAIGKARQRPASGRAVGQGGGWAVGRSVGRSVRLR